MKSILKGFAVGLIISLGVLLIIAGYFVYKASNEYDGNCGIIFGHWPCSKAQYIKESVSFSMRLILYLAFIPILIILIVASSVSYFGDKIRGKNKQIFSGAKLKFGKSRVFWKISLTLFLIIFLYFIWRYIFG